MTLPATDSGVSHPVEAQQPALQTDAAPQRILIVDDERDAAESVAVLLTDMGHSIRQAYSGAEALEAAVEFKPQLVLLDLSMPGMDGFEVAQRLRERDETRDAKIVALTAHREKPFKEALAEADFDGHLLKPVSVRELWQAITAASDPA